MFSSAKRFIAIIDPRLKLMYEKSQVLVASQAHLGHALLEPNLGSRRETLKPRLWKILRKSQGTEIPGRDNDEVAQ